MGTKLARGARVIANTLNKRDCKRPTLMTDANRPPRSTAPFPKSEDVRSL